MLRAANLVGGLEHFYFSINIENNHMIIPIDKYFSEGFKPGSPSLGFIIFNFISWMSWRSRIVFQLAASCILPSPWKARRVRAWNRQGWLPVASKIATLQDRKGGILPQEWWITNVSHLLTCGWWELEREWSSICKRILFYPMFYTIDLNKKVWGCVRYFVI